MGKYKLHFLLAALLLIAAGYFFKNYQSASNDLAAIAQKMQEHLYERENALKEIAEDEKLLKELALNIPSPKIIRDLRHEPWSILLFKNDSLVFWNKNVVFPPDEIDHYKQHDEVIRLKNGYYELIKKRVIKAMPDTFYLVGLIPLKYEYSIHNQYLPNGFAFNFNIPGELQFSLEKRTGTEPVVNEQGDPLFYISFDEMYEEGEVSSIGVAFFGAGLLCLFLWFTFFSAFIGRMTQPLIGFLLLTVMFLFLRWLQLEYYPLFLKQLYFFNPQVYATSKMAPSLGDLFINVILLFWLAVFFFSEVKVRWRPHRYLGLGIMILSYLLILLFSHFVAGMIQSLVIDSNISFDINNFLSLDIFSLIGLLCMASMVAGLYLFSYRLVLINRLFDLPISYGSIALGSALLVYIFIFFPFSALGYAMILLNVLFISGITFFIYKRVRILSFTNIFFWLLFFAVYTALLLHTFNVEKEWDKRRLYAYSLAQEKDFLAEYLFNEIQERLVNDPAVQKYYRDSIASSQELLERINYLYFKDHLNRYDLNIHTYHTDTLEVNKQKRRDFNNYLIMIDSAGLPTSAENLWYISSAGRDLFYLAVLDIPAHVASTDAVGTLVIQLKPKRLSISSVYPELLVEGNIREETVIQEYEHALYINGNLEKHEGDYPYSRRALFEAKGEFSRLESSGYEHLVYKPTPNRQIWISKEKSRFFQPLSLFSYIFCLYLILVILFLFGRATIIWAKNGFVFQKSANFSFRQRVQIYVTLVIVASFIAIGGVTIINITDHYEEYHRERLLRKVKQILAGLEYLEDGVNLSGWGFLKERKNDLFIEIATLSDIHSMDINIFDDQGNLVVTSQPAIFSKGLVTEKIDPLALHLVKESKLSQYIQNERIGKLEYLSAYIPLVNENQELQAIINLPYFAKERNLESEITDFLVYFINIYVLLLMIAGIVGLLVSNSMTRPIAAIGSKMKDVRLGERNEPIVWHNKDEIGDLVRQYNKMIYALDESASKLARSERESAWREMAKQVAHEIKNPLTPMKLSIQHLHRAYKMNDPNLDELVDDVTQTLVEQIENLSRIASEFSSFAKMPVAQNEEVLLNDVVRSVSELYKNQEEVHISIQVPEKEYRVFADKGQLMRLFTNLIKNSVQAIPEGREGIIFMGMKEEDGMVQVKVEDNGVGIPPDQIDQVFVPNFTTKSSGMGLGLAISKNIIESAGGQIWFNTKSGKETTFFVELPLIKTD